MRNNPDYQSLLSLIMNEHLSQHRRFHLLVCLVVIITGSFLSLFVKRDNNDTDDIDNQRSTTVVISSPYCDHLWKQDNYSSMANIIRRSQMFSLFGNVHENDPESSNRSKLNELRMKTLLQRINTIHDNDNDSDNNNDNDNDNDKEVVFKVVVLGNSMTAGMYLTYDNLLIYRTYVAAPIDHYCIFPRVSTYPPNMCSCSN